MHQRGPRAASTETASSRSGAILLSRGVGSSASATSWSGPIEAMRTASPINSILRRAACRPTARRLPLAATPTRAVGPLLRARPGHRPDHDLGLVERRAVGIEGADDDADLGRHREHEAPGVGAAQRVDQVAADTGRRGPPRDRPGGSRRGRGRGSGGARRARRSGGAGSRRRAPTRRRRRRSRVRAPSSIWMTGQPAAASAWSSALSASADARASTSRGAPPGSASRAIV